MMKIFNHIVLPTLTVVAHVVKEWRSAVPKEITLVREFCYTNARSVSLSLLVINLTKLKSVKLFILTYFQDGAAPFVAI